jgi:hypothetical protein
METRKKNPQVGKKEKSKVGFIQENYQSLLLQ